MYHVRRSGPYGKGYGGPGPGGNPFFFGGGFGAPFLGGVIGGLVGSALVRPRPPYAPVYGGNYSPFQSAPGYPYGGGYYYY
ncbi:hypothetical protein [Bacillus testis]|uniref:hypothetical protein n=1 Tax=Bacillus testis TaxID=1622072 RepID=UPI00067EF831|nr:hypothetical protein [Bacillus testis]